LTSTQLLQPLKSLQLTLADASVGEIFTVDKVTAPTDAPEWAEQLQDIGFLSGERVAIMARGLPGGDPLVVRVGLSTYALRLVEAACVRVQPLATEMPA
jgi:ferrous iron transport protein A